MKTATIPSSQTNKYNRWDAHFNIFVSEHSERIKELESKFSKKELIELLLPMPFSLKKYVIILQRGQKSINELRANSIIEQYPFISAVAMELGVDEREQALKIMGSSIRKQRKQLNNLKNKMG